MSSSVGKLQPPVVAFTESKGEIIGSGNYSVLVLDKREVHLYSVNDFKKKAVWVYPYPTVQIVCVQDLNNSLLISLAKNTGSSIVYEIQVYSLETFRQLAVVSAPHEVTSIAPVVNFPLFKNPVCFGCQGGYVYLTDLTFDRPEKDKSIPMRIVSFSTLNENNIKEIQTSKQLPTIFITEKYHTNNNLFEIPDSSTNSSKVSYKTSDIYVSSISCIVPIGAFLVGFNNGSFQLYSLSNTSLIYSFKNTTNNTPIIKACYLQLADDENFGYIWIGQDNCLSLFKLQFKTNMQSEDIFKYRIDNFMRINLDFTRKLGNSKLLMCQSIRDDLIGGEDSNEENRIYLGGYRRCLFNFASIQNTSHYLEIFDLHGIVKPAIGIPNTSNTLFYSLSLSNLSLSSNILSTYLDIHSMNDVSLSSEESNATTLNFSILCLSNDRVQTLTFESILHKAIEWCKQQGVLLFKNPTETLSNLNQLKVLNSSTLNGDSSNLDTLLNFLFLHNLSSLICSYIVDLVPRQSMMLVDESLYTLKNPRSILDWSWQHFSSIKETLNKEYISKIFSEPLHIEKTKYLSIIDNGLVKIVQMYHIMQTLYMRATQEGATEETIDNLNDKLSIIQLFAQYMETLQWCLDNNLFTIKYSTILKELQSKINKRRKYRNQAHINSRIRLNLQNYSTECPLFIDNLLNSLTLNKSTISSSWEYPPKSFENILSLFLSGSPLQIDKKRDIMFYFLLDIESSAKSTITTSLDFANYFSIQNSQQQYISSLWLLDASFTNQDNSKLIKSACDGLASSNSPLSILNFEILCAFHDLKCGFEELKYLRSISSDEIPDSLEKSAIYLQIMLNNGLIFEGYEFMKTYCKTNASALEFLVRQLTNHCLQTNQLITLLNLPFSPEEEDVVVKTLGNFKPNGNDYLCVYFMQRSKYVDAYLLTNSSSSSSVNNVSIDPSLSAILSGYLNILPSVQLESTVYSRENRIQHINEEMEDAEPNNIVSEHHSILFPISRDTSFDSIIEDYQDQLNSTPVQSKALSLTPFKSSIRRSASDMNSSTVGLTPKRVTFSREQQADSDSIMSTPQQLPNNTTISSNGSASANSAIRRSARLSKKFGSGDISILPPATKPKLSAPLPLSSSSISTLPVFRPKPKETRRKHQMQLRNMNALQ